MAARRPPASLLSWASLSSLEAFELAEDVRTRMTWRIAAAHAASILAAAPLDLTTFEAQRREGRPRRRK